MHDILPKPTCTQAVRQKGRECSSAGMNAILLPDFAFIAVQLQILQLAVVCVVPKVASAELAVVVFFVVGRIPSGHLSCNCCVAKKSESRVLLSMTL